MTHKNKLVSNLPADYLLGAQRGRSRKGLEGISGLTVTSVSEPS